MGTRPNLFYDKLLYNELPAESDIELKEILFLLSLFYLLISPCNVLRSTAFSCLSTTAASFGHSYKNVNFSSNTSSAIL